MEPVVLINADELSCEKVINLVSNSYDEKPSIAVNSSGHLNDWKDFDKHKKKRKKKKKKM